MTRTWVLVAALLAMLAAGCAEDMEDVELVEDEILAVEDAVDIGEVPSIELPVAPELGQCKVLPDGQLCAYFHKLANHIRSVTITRLKFNPICNYQPFVDVYDATGRRIARKVGRRNPGCHSGRLTVKVLVDTYFPTGRKACAGINEGFFPGHLPPLAQQVCVPLVPAG